MKLRVSTAERKAQRVGRDELLQTIADLWAAVEQLADQAGVTLEGGEATRGKLKDKGKRKRRGAK